MAGEKVYLKLIQLSQLWLLRNEKEAKAPEAVNVVEAAEDILTSDWGKKNELGAGTRHVGVAGAQAW